MKELTKSADMEIKQLLFSQITLQMLTDADGPYPAGVPVNSKSPIFKVIKRLT